MQPRTARTEHHRPDLVTEVDAILDAVDAPAEHALVALSSGRRCAIDSSDGVDRVTIRSARGELVVALELGPRGPILRVAAIELELEAASAIRMTSAQIHLRAAREMRVEGATVAVQSNEAAVAVRAAGAITLDGESIGLNDDPEPKPFPWSAAADEERA